MNTRLIFALAMALPLAAFADGFDYTYVEAGYVSTEVDAGPVDVDGDGFGLRGSMAVKDNVHLFAGMDDQDLDLGLESSRYDLGVGMNHSLSRDLDFIGQVSYVNADVAVGPISADEDGLGLGVGLRGRAGTSFEYEGGIDYVDLDSSDTSLNVGGRWYFNDTFALGGGLSFDDDDTAWNFGFRGEFGD